MVTLAGVICDAKLLLLLALRILERLPSRDLVRLYAVRPSVLSLPSIVQ